MYWRAAIVGVVCAVYVASIDGEQTPRTAEASKAQTTLAIPGAVNATPSMSTLGRMVAVVWTATKQGVSDVYLATSADAGATFSEPRRVNDQVGDVSPNNEQPPRVVVSGPVNAPVMTVLWSRRNETGQRTRRDVIRLVRSADGGRTFLPARTMHDPSLSGARGWESLAAGPNGVLHAVWLDGRAAERKMAEAAAHAGMPHKGQPPQDIYHGTIASDGRVVENLIATGVCFCCKTAVAVDGRGTVYAAWRHIFPGSMRDIAFAMSTGGTPTFTPLVRVSEDNWQLNGCPEDGPALAVDSAGIIHIAWATLIRDSEDQKALFYATSRDGRTFSARARVPTEGVTNPGHPQLTSLPDGGVAIVWDENKDGVRRVSLTRANGGAPQPPLVLSGSESASHPVVARAGSNLLVAWTSRPAASRTPGEGSVIRIARLNR